MDIFIITKAKANKGRVEKILKPFQNKKEYVMVKSKEAMLEKINKWINYKNPILTQNKNDYVPNFLIEQEANEFFFNDDYANKKIDEIEREQEIKNELKEKSDIEKIKYFMDKDWEDEEYLKFKGHIYELKEDGNLYEGVYKGGKYDVINDNGVKTRFINENDRHVKYIECGYFFKENKDSMEFYIKKQHSYKIPGLFPDAFITIDGEWIDCDTVEDRKRFADYLSKHPEYWLTSVCAERY